MNLDQRLSNIGFLMSSTNGKLNPLDYDIEATLISALYELDNNSRYFSLVFSWGIIHGKHIIADKFFNTYERIRVVKGDCSWVAGFCALLVSLGDRRFSKGLVRSKEPVYLRGRNVDKLIKLKGAIDYLEDINILVPVHYFEFHERKILSVEKLIKKNHQYRNRFLYGANWRSEIITLIELGFEKPYRIAKQLNIGHARVGEVFKEYQLAQKVLS